MNAIVIRDQANAAAQHAFRRLVVRYVETGAWDRHLEAEWHVAEQLLDLADDLIRSVSDTDPSDGDDPLPDVPLARRPVTEDRGDIFVFPAGVGA
jgi:hypothetical protein